MNRGSGIPRAIKVYTLVSKVDQFVFALLEAILEGGKEPLNMERVTNDEDIS